MLKIDKNPLDNKWCLWFSGFVDGEGCFTVRIGKQKNNDRAVVQMVFQVSLSMKDYQIIEEIKYKLGVGNTYTNNSKPRRDKGMDVNDMRTCELPPYK